MASKIDAKTIASFISKAFQSRTIIGGALLALAVAIRGTGFDVHFDSVIPVINSVAIVVAAVGLLLVTIGRTFANGPLTDVGEELSHAADAAQPSPPASPAP